MYLIRSMAFIPLVYRGRQSAASLRQWSVTAHKLTGQVDSPQGRYRTCPSAMMVFDSPAFGACAGLLCRFSATSSKSKGWELVIPNPKLKLVDQVREVVRVKHSAIRTKQAYCEWIRRYVRFDEMRPRAEGGECVKITHI
jgi:hypothetical protein